MSPAELRALMATAERQPGETTEQYTARAIAEHQLSSWRVWLPGLLDSLTYAEPPEYEERLEYERRVLDAEVEGIRSVKAIREAAAQLLEGRARKQDAWIVRYALLTAAEAVRALPDGSCTSPELINPITPASQADGGAPAAVRPDPAGAHSSAEIPLNAVLHVAGNGQVLRMSDAEEVIAALEQDRGANERDDAVRLIRFLAAACAETERAAA